MKIRLVHSITIAIIWLIRIFYTTSIQNISNNFKENFKFYFDDIRYLTYFFLGVSMLLNMFLIKKSTAVVITYWVLVIINIILIAFSLKLW